MPRYDFHCQDCQEVFEVTIPFGSHPCPACPKCQERHVEKLISPPLGIHFKGSGFYKTDVQSSVSKKTGKEEKGGKETTESKKEVKKEEVKPTGEKPQATNTTTKDEAKGSSPKE